MRVIAKRTYKTGLQTLVEQDRHYFMLIQNRRSNYGVEIPAETAMRFAMKMKGER